MKTPIKCLCLGLGAVALLHSGRLNAALLAYDGFNYPTAGASVVGQVDAGPNASFGWNGGWGDNTAQMNTGTQGPVYVNASGLTYSKGGKSLVVSGGMVEQTDSDTYLPFRLLTTPVGGTGDLSATPSTIWVSFLSRSYGRSTTTPQFDPTLATSTNYLLWGTETGVNSSSPPTAGNATYIGGARSATGNFFIGGTGGSSIANFTGSALSGDVHLIVQRINFGGGTTGSSMRVDSWFDPTPGVDPSTNPASFTSTVTGSSAANLQFAGILFRGDESGKGAYDEIRIGETALDVLPVAPVAGDFDGDGDVDGADFVAWQTNFPKLSDATKAHGDDDGDGDVDGADFDAWQNSFPSAAGLTPVPEPGALLLTLLATFGFGAVRILPRRSSRKRVD